MRHLVFLLALPSVALAGGSGTIGNASLNKGQTVAFSETMALDLSMTMTGTPQGDMNMEMSSHAVVPRTVKVLDSTGGEVQKIEVRFGEATNKMKMSMMGMDQEQALPVSGKTYHVTRASGANTVTLPDGTAAPSAEATLVNEKAKGMFVDQGASPFQKCLPTGKLTSGLVVDLTACKDGMLPGGGAEVKEASITLKNFSAHDGRNAAHFDLKMVMEGQAPGGGPAMKMDTSGDVIIDAETGFPLLITMKGPVTMSGSQDGMTMTGSGSLDMKLGASIK